MVKLDAELGAVQTCYAELTQSGPEMKCCVGNLTSIITVTVVVNNGKPKKVEGKSSSDRSVHIMHRS